MRHMKDFNFSCRAHRGRLFILMAWCLVLWGLFGLGPNGLVDSSWAGSCVESGCHSKIMSAKYVHGPVAVESSGMQGCQLCHVPAGEACTKTKGGTFTFQHSKDILCSTCHSAGTGSQHTGAEGKCVSCHNPHSSDVSDRFLK